ncbi:hypothetical protein RDABS01_015587 [Bienertia sinuspersici]
MEMGIREYFRVNLKKFFEDVAKINKNIQEIEKLHSNVRVAYEEKKTAHNASVLKALPSKMEQIVSQTMKRAKLIKDQFKGVQNKQPIVMVVLHHQENNSGEIEIGIGVNSGVNPDKFFEDVEKTNKNLKEIEELHSKLRVAHEETKTAHNAGVVKALLFKMKLGVSQTLTRAKLIKDQLKGLGKKFKERWSSFKCYEQRLMKSIKRSITQAVLYSIGENPNEKKLDLSISISESKTFLQKTI